MTFTLTNARIKAFLYLLISRYIVSRIINRLQQLYSRNRDNSDKNMVELYLSEHENKIEIPVDETLTGADFLVKAIDQLEDSGDIRANKLKTMFEEVKNNDGRQFLVNYAQVPLGVPAVTPTAIISFQGKGSNGLF